MQGSTGYTSLINQTKQRVLEDLAAYSGGLKSPMCITGESALYINNPGLFKEKCVENLDIIINNYIPETIGELLSILDGALRNHNVKLTRKEDNSNAGIVLTGELFMCKSFKAFIMTDTGKKFNILNINMLVRETVGDTERFIVHTVEEVIEIYGEMIKQTVEKINTSIREKGSYSKNELTQLMKVINCVGIMVEALCNGDKNISLSEKTFISGVVTTLQEILNPSVTISGKMQNRSNGYSNDTTATEVLILASMIMKHRDIKEIKAIVETIEKLISQIDSSGLLDLRRVAAVQITESEEDNASKLHLRNIIRV